MTREQYCEALAALCLRLVGAVHTDGPNATVDTLTAIHHLPVPDGWSVDIALPVVLAAMINPDRRLSELLGWTEQLDGGPADLIPTEPPPCNPLGVEMCVAGHLPIDSLEPHEQERVARILKDRGWQPADIALWVDSDTQTISDALKRERSRPAARRIRAAKKAGVAA
ncbi:MAG TPA: hypothetical protein VFV67_33955 [Actinophytocola sp.]|uniref:hypothetical protein n=1 Tax=Actinophytocola sp. TaxID=1872138 RepID=UPI002DB62634|nr:hypothetical protein [Actinophytocola sp.]HEU5475672.1 hypothetical protein [Actinophytocola sp.]